MEDRGASAPAEPEVLAERDPDAQAPPAPQPLDDIPPPPAYHPYPYLLARPAPGNQANRALRLAGPLTTGVLCLSLVVLMVGQLVHANELLQAELADKQSQLTSAQTEVSSLQSVVDDLKERWFGNPAIYQPPPISNTVIKYFDIKGTTQSQLKRSLDTADICKTYGPCDPDPAVPNGVAIGLEWFEPAVNSYTCTTPRATVIPYRYYVLLPRWAPPADGTVKIPLVEKWNALAKSIYVHEAGHVAIDKQDLGALNAQAQKLPSCDALYRFWDDPHVYDKDDADQAAYHARLHADCRPEIGCIPDGWMGW